MQRRLVGLCVGLLVSTVSAAQAAETSCVEAYAKANAKYDWEVKKVEHTLFAMNAGSVGAGVAGAACAAATRKWIACLGLFGAAAAAPQFFKSGYAEKLQKLEDINFVYLVYQDIKKGNTRTEAVHALLADLQKPANDAPAIGVKLVTLMERGQLCKNGRPFARRSDLVEKLN